MSDRAKRLAEANEKKLPGSDAAIAEGCTCPRMDNCRGLGWHQSGEHVRVEGCPLHGDVFEQQHIGQEQGK